MRWKTVISLAGAVGCAPAVTSTTEADTSSTGDAPTTGDSSTPTGPSTSASTSITATDPSSTTTPADSSTGDDVPPVAELCWSSTLARAEGVSHAWSDGESVLAAAHESLLVLDDGGWREEHLEDTRIIDVAARFPTDAWLLATDSVLHWDGVSASVDLSLPGATMQAFGLAEDGVLWVAYMPADDCVGLCEEPPSEVQIRGGDGTWALLDPPGIVATSLVFGTESTWLGGRSGELLRKDGYDEPWVQVETPFFTDIEGLWRWSEGLLVATEYDTYSFLDGAWNIEVEHDSFSGVTALAYSAGRTSHLLYREHIAGELDRTGELRRREQEAWVTTATMAADRDLVALDDGRMIAFGDERGHLVQVIDDPRGTPTVTTVFERTDVGETAAFAIAGDGTLVGVAPSAIQIEGADGWTSADDNSIYGNFGAAAGPSADDLILVSDDGNPLWRFDGEALSPISFAQPREATIGLSDLWMADSGVMFAAGTRTGVLGWPVEPAVVGFDGMAWSEYPAPDQACEAGCLGEVEGHGDALFVAGEGVWEWVDEAWVDVTPFTEQTRYGSLAVGPHGAWVVAFTAEGPRLMQRTGDEWIDHTDALPGAVEANEYRGLLVVDDDTHVSVAWGESLARFDGSTWTEIMFPERGPWTATALIVAPGPRLVVHTGQRIWSGVDCE